MHAITVSLWTKYACNDLNGVSSQHDHFKGISKITPPDSIVSIYS